MICIPSTWFSSHTTSQQHFSSYKHQSRLRSRVHVCPSWPQKFPSRRHALPGAPPSLLQDGPLPRKPRRGRPAVAFARCLRPSELPRLRGAGRRAAPRGLPERRQLGLWRRHVLFGDLDVRGDLHIRNSWASENGGSLGWSFVVFLQRGHPRFVRRRCRERWLDSKLPKGLSWGWIRTHLR